METCLAKPPVTDEQIQKYIEEGMPIQFQRHLNLCDSCAERVRSFREVSATLSAASFRDSCPEVGTLLEYSNDFLSLWQAHGIKRHLSLCAHCTGELEQIVALQFNESQTIAQRVADLKKTIIAAVPAVPTGPLAFRGSAKNLQFEAGDYQITLFITKNAYALNQWEVEGQLIKQKVDDLIEPGQATILEEQVAIETDIDSLGYFVFEDVSLDKFELQLSWDNHIILITQIHVA